MYLPQGSIVYIHTGLFGKNQLVAGEVMSTVMSMSHKHNCYTFIKTGLGIVKVMHSEKIFTSLTAEAKDFDKQKSCGIFASVEDFKQRNHLRFSKVDARVDTYGLEFEDNTKDNPYGYFRVKTFYNERDKVMCTTSTFCLMLFDEINNRLLPGRPIPYSREELQMSEQDIKMRLMTPKSKQEILDDASNSGKRKVFATRKEAMEQITDNVEIIEIDGSMFHDEPKQPTIKDKLIEFVDQQGTSLDMLRAIIDEMP